MDIRFIQDGFGSRLHSCGVAEKKKATNIGINKYCYVYPFKKRMFNYADIMIEHLKGHRLVEAMHEEVICCILLPYLLRFKLYI